MAGVHKIDEMKVDIMIAMNFLSFTHFRIWEKKLESIY